MKFKVVSITGYALICFFTTIILMWLFPNTGLGGVFCFPIAIILSLLGSILISKLEFQINKKVKFIFLFILIIIAQVKTQMYLFPQDNIYNIEEQIRFWFDAYKNYDNIEINKNKGLKPFEKVVIKVKRIKSNNYEDIQKGNKMVLKTGAEKLLFFTLIKKEP